MPHPTMPASVEILTCKNSTSCTTVCESVIARCRRGTRKRAVSMSVIFIDWGLRLFTRAILSFGGHEPLAHLSDAVDVDVARNAVAARGEHRAVEAARDVLKKPLSIHDVLFELAIWPRQSSASAPRPAGACGRADPSTSGAACSG